MNKQGRQEVLQSHAACTLRRPLPHRFEIQRSRSVPVYVFV